MELLENEIIQKRLDAQLLELEEYCGTIQEKVEKA